MLFHHHKIRHRIKKTKKHYQNNTCTYEKYSKSTNQIDVYLEWDAHIVRVITIHTYSKIGDRT